MTGLLVAPPMRDTVRSGIQRLALEAQLQPCFVDADSGGVFDPTAIDVAFVSMDLIGDSTADHPSQALATFFSVLRRSTRLQWLHVCTAGADRPIYRELMGRGVRLTTSTGANAVAVAHSVLAGLLSLGRNVPAWMDAQRRRSWEPLRGDRAPADIDGQTAVVVGLGAIGKEVARMLASIGLSVVGVTRSPRPTAGCDEVHPYSAMAALLPRADWLVLACPLTERTRGLVDADALARLPPTARIVNVSRGAVVVEADLISALTSGRLAGAYLDVFCEEPLPQSSPLWSLPSVLLSAHCAGNSTGHGERAAQMFLSNLDRWIHGRPLVGEMFLDHAS